MRGHAIALEKFGRLVVIAKSHRASNQTLWLCWCDCGNEHFAPANSLLSGRVRSCGCLNHEARVARNTKHGLTPRGARHPMYALWHGMIRRCRDAPFRGYKYYGGKGVTVCQRWQDFGLFLADMGERPSSKHSIDRIDSSGNYEPSNCRWATWPEQNASGRRYRPLPKPPEQP